MKRKLITIAAIFAATISLSSCWKEDNIDDWKNVVLATVTFRPQADGSYYLKQDDSTALIVTNTSLQQYPYQDGKEKRGLIYYKESTGSTLPTPEGYKFVKDVQIMSLDTIYTKKPVLYSEDKASEYGNDPIGIYLTDAVFPTTMIEDGYLMLCFQIPYGYTGMKHNIELVYGANPEDPYELEIHHNGFGESYGGQSGSYVMCFPLEDLPDTHQAVVPLTIKWKSLVTGSIETATFKYRSRTDW